MPAGNKPAQASADPARAAFLRGNLQLAMRLLNTRERIAFACLTAGRIAVGLCDLAIAGAFYLLFVLLQGGHLSRHFSWAPTTILSAAILATALVAFRGLIDLGSARSAFQHTQKLYANLLLRLTEGYSQMRWDKFVQRNRSELLGHALYAARETADFYHRNVELGAALVTVLMMAAALVYQSAIAALCLGCALAVFYALHRFVIRRKLQEAASGRTRSLNALHKYLADLLSSGKDIRAYENQAFFCSRLRTAADRLGENNVRLAYLPQIARTVSDQGAVLVFLGTVILVALMGHDLHSVLSLLVFYFVISRRLLPLISQVAFIAGQSEGSLADVRTVASELEACDRYRASRLPVSLPAKGMVLEMRRSGFSFDGNTPLLRDVNLLLRPGEIAVILGASGAGKTSLLNLIAGILQPDSGAIRVDRSRLAYVSQEVPLLDDSVRNNLLFGLPYKSDEELMRVLAIARLDAFIRSQPLGLDTCVGDNGSLFSEGQRQRLGLARAVLRPCELLLLDETTSGLDVENERQILDNLSGLHKAILLVTHRVHARSYADRVFRLENGSLVEELSHASSFGKPGSRLHAETSLQGRWP